ncbi:MAG: hypothetical protein ACYC27_03445 [Armatimonadota bacterium]
MVRIKRFTLMLCAVSLTCAVWAGSNSASAAGFDTKVLRAAGIGLLVSETGPELNKFVNTVTFQRKVPIGLDTKVVPILSIGEKGYVGAAQVAGPASYVRTVKAVWQYEDNFSNNEFRLKILVPSASLNPLQLKKVQKVGVTAIIDVSLDGRWKGQSVSNSVDGGDILKAGVVAVAINAASNPLNKAINAVTKGMNSNTKVIPLLTIGNKAYIGGVQVSGSAALVKSAKNAFQFEELFDGGKYRVKIIVPSSSSNPLKFSRIKGIGITALIDTSIADQERIRNREREWRSYTARPVSLEQVMSNRFKGDVRVDGRKDQGLHKGWYIGKGNQRKQLSGVWQNRYSSLNNRDKEAFVIWWNNHYKDNPKDLEKRWSDWKNDRNDDRNKSWSSDKKDDKRNKDKDKGKSKGRNK